VNQRGGSEESQSEEPLLEAVASISKRKERIEALFSQENLTPTPKIMSMVEMRIRTDSVGVSRDRVTC